MKKVSVFIIFLALLLSFSVLTGFGYKESLKRKSALAIDINNEKSTENDYNYEAKSKELILLDGASGTVIYKHNVSERRPIASMCKVMTLLLTFEEIDNGNLSESDVVCVSENAAGMGGSQVFLEANAEYPVSELIKSIVVASANDSCVALAELICGSESEFVDKMNERAKKLGMDNTLFANCTGLPKDTQYSCAEDVAKMFSELIKHKEYFNYSSIWMDDIHHPNDRVTQISNTNKLIRFYNGCDCGKTGYTSEAGHCLVASAFRDGTRLICVAIGSPDSKARFNEVSNMFNYGFANYCTRKIIDDNKPILVKLNSSNGKKDTVGVYTDKPLVLFAKKNEKRVVELEYIPLENIKAPIKKDDIIGKVIVLENGKEIMSANLLANEDIAEKNYSDRVNDLINNWSLAS